MVVIGFIFRQWLALNPEREDIYAALLCSCQRELQDIFWLSY